MVEAYFVFRYYTSKSRLKSCLVPLQVVGGELEEVAPGRFDPEVLNEGDRTEACLRFLRERGVTKVWSCGGHTMYDEVLGFPTHFSGGEGKYAFHYDSIVGDNLGGIEVEKFTREELSDEDRRGSWALMNELYC